MFGNYRNNETAIHKLNIERYAALNFLGNPWCRRTFWKTCTFSKGWLLIHEYLKKENLYLVFVCTGIDCLMKTHARIMNYYVINIDKETSHLIVFSFSFIYLFAVKYGAHNTRRYYTRSLCHLLLDSLQSKCPCK